MSALVKHGIDWCIYALDQMRADGTWLPSTERWIEETDAAREELAALRKRCEALEKAIEAAYREGWSDGNREGESAGQSLGVRMGRATESGDWEHSDARKALRGGA